MRSVKYEMLSDAERSQWEALDAETYEESDYRVFMDEESYSVIQDICTAALYDNFGWMLNLAFIHGGVISRNEHNPEFCRLLRRAYEHAVASGDAGACCNLGNMYHNTSGTGTTEDYAAAIMESYYESPVWYDKDEALLMYAEAEEILARYTLTELG